MIDFENCIFLEATRKGDLEKSCSLKFCNIYRKAPAASESLFNEVGGLLKRGSNTGVFLCILQNF